MKCELLRQQFHPYMDGELDPPAVVKVQNHLRACAACSHIYRDGIEMRRAVKRHATYYTAGTRLREQIEGSVRLTKRAGWTFGREPVGVSCGLVRRSQLGRTVQLIGYISALGQRARLRLHGDVAWRSDV